MLNHKKLLKQIYFTFIISGLISLFVFFDSVSAASLYISPASGTYRQGETFQVSVYVSSADQAMNTAEANISYPTDKLEITSITTVNSIFTLLVENPRYNNNNGTAYFSGIVVNPGYQGKSGRLVRINFRGKALGQATVNISSGQVLANDGLATNILTGRSGGKYTIIEKPKPAPTPEKPPVEEPVTPVPEPVIPTTTPIIEITPCTTTVNIVTSTVCSLDNLPYVFLKIGSLVFDGESLSLLLLILMIITTAIISLWGFFEAYIHSYHDKKRKKITHKKTAKKEKE